LRTSLGSEICNFKLSNFHNARCSGGDGGLGGFASFATGAPSFWIEEFYFREFYGKFAQSIIFKFVVNHD
jgi:hypothetical protein